MVLMMKDIPVMQIIFAKGIYKVLNEKYLPFYLKGKVSSDTSIPMNHIETSDAVMHFFAQRVLPLDRENAKKIMNALKLCQVQTDYERTKISLAYRSVCLQDNYWVKGENDKATWKDVDIRQNSLNKSLAQVALHGDCITLQGQVAHTPEISTLGAYAKCWKRDDGKLWLYKKGSRGEEEARVEVEVSKILDKTNVVHLNYYDASSEGIYCCKCECMTNQTLSMLSGLDYISYCNKMGINWQQNLIKLDPEAYYHMLVVDYLVSNTDRHLLNWGLYYNCDTMELLGLHPLYDHNNAFDRKAMQNENYQSHFYDNKSLYEVAKMAIKRCDFHFTDKIKKSDFYYRDHYKSFVERAGKLGLRV